MAKSREAFRTISEVSEWLDTPAHVLRFWESKFTQIRPVKRAGGRRYYRPEDMALLAGIKHLLHEQGMTIKGAQKLLREKGVAHVSSLVAGDVDSDAPTEIAAPAPEQSAPPERKPAKTSPDSPAGSNVVRFPPEPDTSQPGLFDMLDTAADAAAVPADAPAAPAPEAPTAHDPVPGGLGIVAHTPRAAIARKAKMLAPLLARLEEAAAARRV